MSSRTQSSHDKPEEEDLQVLKDNGYTPGRVLGAGSYSQVILVHQKHVARAVKVINKVKCPRDYLETFLPRELEIFPTLQHENIVRCHKILESPSHHFIVMEYADSGNLLERIQEEGQIEEEEAKGLFRQTARAVQYCHQVGVAHRDLKLDNFLLSRCNGLTKVKLIDFGFSVWTRNSSGERILSQTFCGSELYAAPEVLQKQGPYDAAVADTWSMGVILYGMLYFRMPFNDSDVDSMIHHQLCRRIKFPAFPAVSEECKELVKLMLEPDVDKRISVDAILECKWLNTT